MRWGSAKFVDKRTDPSLVHAPIVTHIKFVGRTSRGHTGGRSHMISHPPSFCVVLPRKLETHDSHSFQKNDVLTA